MHCAGTAFLYKHSLQAWGFAKRGKWCNFNTNPEFPDPHTNRIEGH